MPVVPCTHNPSGRTLTRLERADPEPRSLTGDLLRTRRLRL